MKITKITPVGKKKVYDISVTDAHHYILENGVVTHNTGIMYSSDTVIIFGKSQEKDGAELSGWTFTMNIEKSRRVKEKSKLPFTVKFEGGIQRWSGLLDLALESGHVVKPSNGWYSKVDPETGEVEDKKYREKDTNTSEFWLPIVKNESFQEWVKNRFQIANGALMQEEDSAEELDTDD